MVVPAVLVEVLRRREAVLVAGAGCGALAGAPPWRTLVEALAAQLIDREEQRQVRALAASGRTAAALAALTERLGPQAAARVVVGLASGERALPPALVALAAAP